MRPRSIPPSFVASVCHPSSWAGRRVTRVITRGEALQTLRDSVVTLLLLLVINTCLTTLPRSSSRITSSSQCVFPGATLVGFHACFPVCFPAHSGAHVAPLAGELDQPPGIGDHIVITTVSYSPLPSWSRRRRLGASLAPCRTVTGSLVGQHPQCSVSRLARSRPGGITALTHEA